MNIANKDAKPAVATPAPARNAPTAERRQYRMSARAESMAATREAILGAAREAFTARPFDDVTLNDVASASGVTVQTVIRRFGGKEQLFSAVAEQERSRILASREVPVNAEFDIALDALLDHYETDGEVVLHLLAQEERVGSVAEVVRQGRRVHREWVERHCAFAIGSRTGAARERAIHAAFAATDLGTWKLLRTSLGLERNQVAAVMAALIEGLKGES